MVQSLISCRYSQKLFWMPREDMGMSSCNSHGHLVEATSLAESLMSERPLPDLAISRGKRTKFPCLYRVLQVNKIGKPTLGKGNPI